MDDLLAGLLQILGEALSNALFNAPFDLSTYRRESRRASARGEAMGFVALFFLAGLGVAGLTLLVMPAAAITREWVRVANLFVGPLLTATLSWLVARIRRRRDPSVSPARHFARSLAFSFGFALIRFAYARH
ncbi:MAG TPA: hypothetical protein VIM58_07825 [Candidatus Methylacidiphilales bacterium]